MLRLAALATALVASTSSSTGRAQPLPYSPTPDVWLAVNTSSTAACPPAPAPWTLVPPRPVPFDRYCEYRSAAGASADPYGDLEHPLLYGLATATVGRVLPQQQAAVAQPLPAHPPSRLTPLARDVQPYLWADYVRQAEIPDRPAVMPSNPSVRLAIVDTKPDSVANPNAEHGRTMAKIASAIACDQPQGPCAIDIRSYLAMPRGEGGRYDGNGGHYGTLWDLALAIAAAVNQHVADPASDRLVINLSLGWFPEVQDTLPAQPYQLFGAGYRFVPAPLQAVHTAIVYAHCSGAAVVASTGNDEDGEEIARGALLPAGWARRIGPTSSDCRRLFFGAPTRALSRIRAVRLPSVPLLYAVGGLDHRGRPLENARAGSTPEVTVPASGVFAPGAGQVISGTSAAAVVASTTLALMWATDPSLAPSVVWRHMVGASASTSRLADLYPSNASRPFVRRLSVCAAQRTMCTGEAVCRTFQCPAPWGEAPRSSELFTLAALATFYRSGLTVLSFAPSPHPVGGCGTILTSTATPQLECPLDAGRAVHALDLAPQPFDPMCPACAAFPVTPQQIAVNLDIVPVIPGGVLDHVILSIRDHQGIVTRYAVPPGQLPEGFRDVILVDVPGGVPTIVEAWLQYTLRADGKTFMLAEPILAL